jgi:hypothetical protein
VTFTSRQQPRDGPYGESCTHWQVRMFFDGSAGVGGELAAEPQHRWVGGEQAPHQVSAPGASWFQSQTSCRCAIPQVPSRRSSRSIIREPVKLGGVRAPAAQLHDSGLNQLEAAKNPAICGALSVIAEVCHHRVPARR